MKTMKTIFRYYKKYIPFMLIVLAALFGQVWCELSLPNYMSDIIDNGIVKGDMDHIDYLRAKHVVGEDERVFRAVECLGKDDIAGFGQLLYESHESSRVNFENSCPELDVLVELSKSIPGCLGARLSGGGFGGISIHLVETDKAESYAERLKTAYKSQTGIDAATFICSIGDGAGVEA